MHCFRCSESDGGGGGREADEAASQVVEGDWHADVYKYFNRFESNYSQ